MTKSISEVVMNPVRQRIAQYLILHETGTVNEIAADLNDIPKPSLYRHINVLLDAGFIEVVAEKSVRGAVQRTFRLVAQPIGDPDREQMASLAQGILASAAAAYASYFAREDADPKRDMLSLSSSVLMLSDDEMMEFLQRIGEVYNLYLENKPSADRKPRNIMFLSVPVERESEKNAEN